MLGRQIVAVSMALAPFLLQGCATSRSELRIDAPPAPKAAAAGAPLAVIRNVADQRTFEQAPSNPATPSLGFEGAAAATADVKARAIGRKRNTFGQALGDVLLQSGQTVASVVRDNLAAVLRDAGYRVEDAVTDGATVIDVRIRQFWTWSRPGFSAITANVDIDTDLDVSPNPRTVQVTTHYEEGRAFLGDDARLEIFAKALAQYRKDLAQKLSERK